MVDVGSKPETSRRATAAVVVRFSAGVLARVLSGNLPKGAVLEAARLAGIMAAKRTSELIPLCHPLRLTSVKLDFRPVGAEALEVSCEVLAFDRTGVEMEALTGASVSALTIYDMAKAVDREMVITDLRLISKQGGQRGDYVRREP